MAAGAHLLCVRSLLCAGVDLINAYDDQGKSPLDYAVYFCHKDAAEYLRSLHGGKLPEGSHKHHLHLHAHCVMPIALSCLRLNGARANCVVIIIVLLQASSRGGRRSAS